jgi:transposase
VKVLHAEFLHVAVLAVDCALPQQTKKLGRMMRRHMKKNMEILSGVDNHQWRRRVCCKDQSLCFLSCAVLSIDTIPN